MDNIAQSKLRKVCDASGIKLKESVEEPKVDKLLIAIDFDGTLCENAWPNVGAPKWDVINKIKEMQEQGHEFILWTCRENADLIPVFKFLGEVGLTFRWINSNAEYRVKQFDNKDCRKIGADYYVDDKALSINDFVNLKVE